MYPTHSGHLLVAKIRVVDAHCVHGLTHNPASPLAQTASMLLPSAFDDPGSVLPSDEPRFETLSYLASMTGLYALAVRLGELSNRLSQSRAGKALMHTQAHARSFGIPDVADEDARPALIIQPASTFAAVAARPFAPRTSASPGSRIGLVVFLRPAPVWSGAGFNGPIATKCGEMAS